MHFASEQATDDGYNLPITPLWLNIRAGLALNFYMETFLEQPDWIRIRHCRGCEETG